MEIVRCYDVNITDVYDDDNNGYIYGLQWDDEFDNTIDCQWFKTEQERDLLRDQIKKEIEYNKYKRAYILLEELWFNIPLSDETYNSIDCELADDITALYNKED